MKRSFNNIITFILILLATACNKSNTVPRPISTITDTTIVPPKTDTVVRDTSATHPLSVDSLALILHKWISYQDTVSSINYGNQYGAPISGVLYNPAGDFWDFGPNGNLSAVLQGTPYTTSYSFLGNNQILIISLPAGLTSPCTILTLTSDTFIFICTATSGNGGTYYRRVWLRR